MYTLKQEYIIETKETKSKSQINIENVFTENEGARIFLTLPKTRRH